MSTNSFERVFIGFGSNLGDREDNIRRAVAWLGAQSQIRLETVSRFMETPPWGVLDQPAFINAAAVVETTLSPHALLRLLKRGESDLGRAPNGLRWGPRVIDLDILLFGDRVVHTEDLMVPHPRITERVFVMMQIVELDGAVVHPLVGRTVLSLLREVESRKI